MNSLRLEGDLPDKWEVVVRMINEGSIDALDIAMLPQEQAWVEDVAERLVDKGVLHVVRAGEYKLTPRGRELIEAAPDIAVPQPPQMPTQYVILLVVCAAICLGLVVWWIT